jgi:hypothetical protein
MALSLLHQFFTEINLSLLNVSERCLNHDRRSKFQVLFQIARKSYIFPEELKIKDFFTVAVSDTEINHHKKWESYR